MAIMIVADSVDEIPEALRKDAAAANGKFTIAIPAGWAVEDVKGLKTALQAERGARQKAETSLAAFDGIDDAPAAKEALEKLRAGGLKSSKDIEEFKATVEKKFGDERAKLQAERDALRKSLESEVVEKAAIAALTAKGGGKSLRALLPLVKQAIRVEHAADGKLKVTLADDKGSPLVTRKSGSTDPMAIEEFVDTLRESADLKALFEASSAGGSGAHSQNGGSARTVPHDGKLLSPRELLMRAGSS